jgi:hypothetical protein
MNQKNYDFLTDALKYLGFDDKLNTLLEKNMQENNPAFQLQQEYEFNKKPIHVTLHFRKGGPLELYYFNKYQATVKIKEEERTQLFYIEKNSGITLKEAFNLLQGRAVFKELSGKAGDVYHAWIQLDLKEKEANGNYKQKLFHENYGYQLTTALEQYPIQELREEKQKDTLIKSLKKGNLQAVNFDKAGGPEKMFVEANPQYKTVTVYDARMNRVNRKEGDKMEPAAVE